MRIRRWTMNTATVSQIYMYDVPIPFSISIDCGSFHLHASQPNDHRNYFLKNSIVPSKRKSQNTVDSWISVRGASWIVNMSHFSPNPKMVVHLRATATSSWFSFLSTFSINIISALEFQNFSIVFLSLSLGQRDNTLGAFKFQRRPGVSHQLLDRCTKGYSRTQNNDTSAFCIRQWLWH